MKYALIALLVLLPATAQARSFQCGVLETLSKQYPNFKPRNADERKKVKYWTDWYKRNCDAR